MSGESHYYEPNELVLETGKLYKLKLINHSDSKHYFSSSSFSKSIFTRKIQVNFDSKKTLENGLYFGALATLSGSFYNIWHDHDKSSQHLRSTDLPELKAQ